jgi:S-adenosylmethionine decarboxylase
MSDTSDKSYWVRKDGMTYAGVHLIIDLWGVSDLDDMEKVRSALLDCVSACGATLRDLNLFQFSEGGGIAGVVMLMQSHITIHSWPEERYGAFDAFVCGETDPYKIIPVLKEAFRPKEIQVAEYRRGLRV